MTERLTANMYHEISFAKILTVHYKHVMQITEKNVLIIQLFIDQRCIREYAPCQIKMVVFPCWRTRCSANPIYPGRVVRLAARDH